MLAGQYHSVFKGRGMAFSEVRQYQPGDEIRTIDWNVTARMNDAYIKVFTEERELTVMLLVDVSASEEFGSRERTKAEVAAEVAAQIAFSRHRQQRPRRAGALLGPGGEGGPAAQGPKHVLRLVSDILTFQPKGKGRTSPRGSTTSRRWRKRKAVTFLISDFLAADYEKPLRIVGRRARPGAGGHLGPAARPSSPKLGWWSWRTRRPASGCSWTPADPRVRGAFARDAAGCARSAASCSRSWSWTTWSSSAGEDHGAALARFFRARARRMAA